MLADYVTMDQGTGAVHTAPSHGADDFYTGQKYNLDQTCNVDDAGRLHHGLPEYDGKKVFEANDSIVELLKSRGVLLHLEKIEHSYPHCWRCHNPVIFRATEQWFISMEAKIGGGTLRSARAGRDQESALGSGLGRRAHLQHDRHPARLVHLAPARLGRAHRRLLLRRLRRIPERAGGAARRRRAVPARGRGCLVQAQAGGDLPAGTRCAKCGGTQFRKEMDIIDVWFESGSSYLAVESSEPDLPWPSDMYLEGGDQYRGWFHSSLLCSIGARNSAPYKTVGTIGWTLDKQGRAMPKSLGNDVDPVDIAKRMGAEIVRLWVASVDFREDVRSDETLMQRIAETYRKIRNTFRYIVGNLYDFDPQRDAVPFADMEFLDRVALAQTAEISQRVLGWYDDFLFHRVFQDVNEFCVDALSKTYFDMLKDRLYTFAPNSRARRSAQTAIWRIGEALVRLLAPLMSFTAEEVWGFLPKLASREPSVHLATVPQAREHPRRGLLVHQQGNAGAAGGMAGLVTRSRRGAEGAGSGPQPEADRFRAGGRSPAERARVAARAGAAPRKGIALLVHRFQRPIGSGAFGKRQRQRD